MRNERKNVMWHILWSNYLKEMGNNIKIGGCKSGSG
jgi:hypothetical protein